MLDGALPVRDYVERGIPLMSAVSAAAQAVLGAGLHAEVQLIAGLFAAAAALTHLVAARLSGSMAIGLAAAALTVAIHPVSYSYPKLLAYAATFLAAWRHAERPSTGRLALLALTVVAAFLFRHDHGVFLGLGSAVLLAVLHGPRRAIPILGTFVLIGLLFASPYVVWVQAHEGVATYVADGVAFSRREAERSARFELPAFGVDATRPLFTTVTGGPVVNVRWVAEAADEAIAERERAHGLTRLDPVGERTWRYELSRWSAAVLERLVRDPAVADTHGIDRSRFRLTDADPGLLRRLLLGTRLPGEGLRLRANAVAALYYLAWAVPAMAAAVLAAWWTRLSSPLRAVVPMVVAVQLLLNVTMLRDPIDLRVRDVVAPLAVLLAFVAGWAWVGFGGRMLRWMVRVAAAVLLGAALTAAAALGPAAEHLDQARLFDGLAGIAARRAELRDEFRPPAQRTGAISEAYRRLVDYVTTCTPEDARLFVMTFAPELVFYTGRGFAAGQVALPPGYYVNERHATLMLERLARETVPFVIVDSEIELEMAQQYPRVVEQVTAAYHRVAEFPISGDKRFIVLAENGRTAAGVFGRDRLPCYAPARA